MTAMTPMVRLARVDMQTGQEFDCPADAHLRFDSREDAMKKAQRLNAALPTGAEFFFTVPAPRHRIIVTGTVADESATR